MKKSLYAILVIVCWTLGFKAFANLIDSGNVGKVIKTTNDDKGNGNRGSGNMKSNYDK